MLINVENRRPGEAEDIIGDLVRRADPFGIEVPILRAALCNLQIYEARRRSGAECLPQKSSLSASTARTAFDADTGRSASASGTSKNAPHYSRFLGGA
jgi:hypothetical protein